MRLAAIFLWPGTANWRRMGLVRRKLPPLNRRTVEYFLVAAFVIVGATNLIFLSAVPQVGASFVALAIAFPPLLTYLGALTLGMERFDGLRAGGVALALAGAIALAAFQLSLPDTTVFWILLTLCGRVLLAIGNLYGTLRWTGGTTGDALARQPTWSRDRQPCRTSIATLARVPWRRRTSTSAGNRSRPTLKILMSVRVVE